MTLHWMSDPRHATRRQDYDYHVIYAGQPGRNLITITYMLRLPSRRHHFPNGRLSRTIRCGITMLEQDTVLAWYTDRDEAWTAWLALRATPPAELGDALLPLYAAQVMEALL